jgi:hypothetical protein
MKQMSYASGAKTLRQTIEHVSIKKNPSTTTLLMTLDMDLRVK